MNQIYYLDETPVIQDFDLLTWIYKWRGKIAYSEEMKKLIEKNYFEN
jgi:hypothetical protein